MEVEGWNRVAISASNTVQVSIMNEHISWRKCYVISVNILCCRSNQQLLMDKLYKIMKYRCKYENLSNRMIGIILNIAQKFDCSTEISLKLHSYQKNNTHSKRIYVSENSSQFIRLQSKCSPVMSLKCIHIGIVEATICFIWCSHWHPWLKKDNLWSNRGGDSTSFSAVY